MYPCELPCKWIQIKSCTGSNKAAQPALLCSVGISFVHRNPRNCRKPGLFHTYISAQTSLPQQMIYYFFGGGSGQGREKKGPQICVSATAQIPRLPNAKAEQNKEICILSDAKQPAAFECCVCSVMSSSGAQRQRLWQLGSPRACQTPFPWFSSRQHHRQTARKRTPATCSEHCLWCRAPERASNQQQAARK